MKFARACYSSIASMFGSPAKNSAPKYIEGTSLNILGTTMGNFFLFGITKYFIMKIEVYKTRNRIIYIRFAMIYVNIKLPVGMQHFYLLLGR